MVSITFMVNLYYIYGWYKYGRYFFPRLRQMSWVFFSVKAKILIGDSSSGNLRQPLFWCWGKTKNVKLSFQILRSSYKINLRVGLDVLQQMFILMLVLNWRLFPTRLWFCSLQKSFFQCRFNLSLIRPWDNDKSLQLLGWLEIKVPHTCNCLASLQPLLTIYLFKLILNWWK